MSDTPRNDAHQCGQPDPVEGRWLNERELRLMLERECATWKEAATAREGAERKLREVEAYAGACRRAGFELTAALAQMEPWSADDISTEYLNRERVMQLVMDWRRKVDAASAAQRGHAQCVTQEPDRG